MPKVRPDLSISSANSPVTPSTNIVFTGSHGSQVNASDPGMRDANVIQESNSPLSMKVEDTVTEGLDTVPPKFPPIGTTTGKQLDAPKSVSENNTSTSRIGVPLKIEPVSSPLDQATKLTSPLVQEVNALRITPSRDYGEEEVSLSARRKEKQRSIDSGDQQDTHRSFSTPGSVAPPYHSSDLRQSTASEPIPRPPPIYISTDQKERLYDLAFEFIDR